MQKQHCPIGVAGSLTGSNPGCIYVEVLDIKDLPKWDCSCNDVWCGVATRCCIWDDSADRISTESIEGPSAECFEWIGIISCDSLTSYWLDVCYYRNWLMLQWTVLWGEILPWISLQEMLAVRKWTQWEGSSLVLVSNDSCIWCWQLYLDARSSVCENSM